MSTKILGIIMAKDEDELISISVSHALMTVCDEICILIHDSRSSFTKEVSELLRLWPGKIKLFKLDIKQYYQESAVTALRYYAESDQFDWIYVFDADEFANHVHMENLRFLKIGPDSS